MDLALLPCCLARAYDDEDNLVCKRYFEKLGLNEHKINYLWTKYKRISNGLGHKILNPGDVLLVYELDDSHFNQMVTNAADFKHVHRVDFKDNVYSIWNFLTLDVDAMLLFMFDLYQSKDKITPEDIIHMLKDTYHTEFDTNFNCQQIVKHEIPKFEDEFFDMIYIDGNHEPEFVLEDAVLSFRKLKKGGWMIFDDYGWVDISISDLKEREDRNTKHGIDAFLNAYRNRIYIENAKMFNHQVFVQKKV